MTYLSLTTTTLHAVIQTVLLGTKDQKARKRSKLAPSAKLSNIAPDLARSWIGTATSLFAKRCGAWSEIKQWILHRSKRLPSTDTIMEAPFLRWEWNTRLDTATTLANATT
jgi:hypothetical protein